MYDGKQQVALATLLGVPCIVCPWGVSKGGVRCMSRPKNHKFLWKTVCFKRFDVHVPYIGHSKWTRQIWKIINISLDVSSNSKLIGLVFGSPMALELENSLPKACQTLQIPGRNEHVLPIAATATKTSVLLKFRRWEALFFLTTYLILYSCIWKVSEAHIFCVIRKSINSDWFYRQCWKWQNVAFQKYCFSPGTFQQNLCFCCCGCSGKHMCIWTWDL